MKNITSLLFVLLTQLMFSQDSLIFQNKVNDLSLDHHNLQGNSVQKNMVKFNFLILNMPAASFEYERLLTRKISVATEVSFIGKQQFNLLKLMSNELNDNEFTKNQLRKVRYSGFTITPEIKLYLGKKSLRGFYISPFIRFTHYNVKFPLQIINNTFQDVNFKGNLSTVTAGISVGAQWKIYKNFYLDWLIMGPHFGNSKNYLDLNKNLSEQEQKAISESLNLIKNGIDGVDGLPGLNFDYSVNDSGAKIRFRNPWLGLRMHLGIGYRF